jgi:hypothetical protein
MGRSLIATRRMPMVLNLVGTTSRSAMFKAMASIYVRYGKNRDSAMRDARSYAVVPLPSDQRSDGHLDPGIVRFLRDGATRPTSALEQFPGRSNREGIPKEARIGFKIPAGTKGARHEW